MSVDDVSVDYAAWCAANESTVNSGLRGVVPTSPSECGQLRELDCSRNIVGSKGVAPLVQMITTHCHSLVCINLAQNYLDNEAVRVLYNALVVESGCPSLISIELSNNPISNPAGKLLSRLADARPQTKYIGVRGTLMNLGLVKLIEGKVAQRGGVTPDTTSDTSPGSHWPAIETLWRLTGTSAPPPEGDWSGLATVMAVVRKDDAFALPGTLSA